MRMLPSQTKNSQRANQNKTLRRFQSQQQYVETLWTSNYPWQSSRLFVTRCLPWKKLGVKKKASGNQTWLAGLSKYSLNKMISKYPLNKIDDHHEFPLKRRMVAANHPRFEDLPTSRLKKHVSQENPQCKPAGLLPFQAALLKLFRWSERSHQMPLVAKVALRGRAGRGKTGGNFEWDVKQHVGL